MTTDALIENDWMTLEETAQWLRVSKKTVERAVRNHRLPVFQVEHTLRIYRPELIARAKSNVQSDERDDDIAQAIERKFELENGCYSTPSLDSRTSEGVHHG